MNPNRILAAAPGTIAARENEPEREQESERLDNAPLAPKFRHDTHIAGAPELATAVALANAEPDLGVAERSELAEMALDASSALAEGMGADDARTESLIDEDLDRRASDLRTDLTDRDQNDEEPAGTPSPTER